MDSMTTATDDYCLNCWGENPQYEYDDLCYECYINKNPNLDTGIGRCCDECQDELHMHKWVKIYGDDPKEYCLNCWDNICGDN